MTRPWRGRNRVGAFALALCVCASAAAADQKIGSAVASGWVQVGGREVAGDTDSAEFEEYRDIRQGIFGAGRVTLEDELIRYYLTLGFYDVGERDQQYLLEAGRYGHYGLRLDYSEIPHVFSNQALTPYVAQKSDVLELPANFDRDLFDTSGAAAFNAQMQAFSPPVSLEFRTIFGTAEAFARPNDELDFSLGYRIIDKKGTRAQGLGFGSPGGTFVNVAAPIDERIHEVRAGGQFVRERWNVGLSYTGSFFENQLNSVTVDNPLTSTATPGESDVGRYSLSPDNSAQNVSLSGAWLLPVDAPTRLAGTFSWGLHLQDQDFLPQTSNSTIANDPVLQLPQSSLHGRVQTLLGNLVFTSRPVPKLNLKARYRIYDYDNQTDDVHLTGFAVNDRNPGAEERTALFNDYTRQNASGEAAWRVIDPLTLTLGFEWENWSRSKDREVRHNNSYGPVAKLDYRITDTASIRADYHFRARRGNEYFPLAPIQAAFPAAEVPGVALGAKFEELRKYDEADLVSNDFSVLALLHPRSDLSITFSGGFGVDDWDESDFGLTSANRWNVGADVGYRPLERLGFNASYSYDSIWAEQSSTQRNRNFTPPIMITGEFPWESTTRDHSHNLEVGIDAVLIPRWLDWDASYFLQRGSAKTDAGGSAATAVDYPPIKDRLRAVTTNFNLHLFSDNLTFRATYRWEDYHNSNFHYDDLQLSDSRGDVTLQNAVADYDAHIISVSAIVSF